MKASSFSWKPTFSSRSRLPSMLSVKRNMLKTMSSFLARAQVRMFWASSRLVAKIVEAMPNEKFECLAASACMASMV